MRVLIVDDDIVQATLLKELVEIFEGDHVSNGEDAFFFFKKAHEENAPYNLIFMDLMMPGFDGYMVLDAMRKYEAEHRVEASKVIVISGKSIEEGLTPQLQRQCDDYLSKPVDSQRVLSSMEALGII